MIIFKYAVLFILFSSVSLIGNLISKKYRNRVMDLKDFKEICNILQSKIKFTYEPLGEILEEISKIIQNNNIKELLKNTNKNLKEKDFKTSWEDAIDEQKMVLDLNNEDISIIKGLGKMLGKTDTEGQISEIRLTMDFLDTQIQEAELECRKNEKMYRSLGTIFGLAIVIILV